MWILFLEFSFWQPQNNEKNIINISIYRGPRVTQLVSVWLCFGSGHDLRVSRWRPVSSSKLREESPGVSLSLPLFLPCHSLAHGFSLALFLCHKQINLFKKLCVIHVYFEAGHGHKGTQTIEGDLWFALIYVYVVHFNVFLYASALLM